MEKKYTRRQFVARTAVVSAAAGIGMPVFAATEARTQFTASRIWPAQAYTRITLEAGQMPEYRYFVLESPPRVVVDINNAAVGQAVQSLAGRVQKNDPYVAGIRVGQNTPDTVRLVIDLKRNVNPQLFTLKPVSGSFINHRLVIDLYPRESHNAADPLMALLNDTSAGRNTPQPAAKPAVAAANTPAPARRLSRKPVIVLDPGHGGEDPGAISAGGLREKDVVLSIARQAKKMMESKGYQVYLTRNEDVFIPLAGRVAKARNLKADVFVSIHADAFTSPNVRGTGVFALSTTGASSAAAKYLETSQNASDQIGGIPSIGNRVVDSTLLDMAQTATGKDSGILGTKVLRAMKRYNTLHKEEVDRANFAVLRAPDVPSILVETAFLSNPIEERMLRSASFRTQCATAITAGVQEYLSGAVLARR